MRRLISCCAFLMQTTYSISVFGKFIAICLRVVRLVIALCCLIWIYNRRPRRAFVCAAAATPTLQHLRLTSRPQAAGGRYSYNLAVVWPPQRRVISELPSPSIQWSAEAAMARLCIGKISNRFGLLSRFGWLAALALVNWIFAAHFSGSLIVIVVVAVAVCYSLFMQSQHSFRHREKLP